MMKKTVAIFAGALALAISGQAMAQTVSVTVAPEQRTHIKEYIKRERVAPVTTIKERVRVGGRVPADVELRQVPEDWGPSVSRYRYIYHDDRVQFVDPTSREIVYDVD
jgi:hypothetical protein